jgi:predicted DNA-binding antitoxin AbrB/MazE fold protein
MIYRGHIQNGVVVLDEDVKLPDGTEVHVEAIPGRLRKTLAERFQDVIGAVNDLPSDIAENHDHYLYGTPKNP